MAQLPLHGAYTALVTPFSSDGTQLDLKAFEDLVAAQLKAGVTGLVPCGTTGETPTLSDAEQRELIQVTAKLAKGKAFILAGTGTNNTMKSIAASQAALEAGADAVMIVMPYYNKPSQEGLMRHVELIAKAVEAPVVLYNIPGRSAVSLSAETTLRILEQCSNVVGIKDATGTAVYCQEVLSRAGDRVAIMSGDDPQTLPLMSVGAKGVISVTSNLYPEAVVSTVQAVGRGEWKAAQVQNQALFPVHRALFLEPNPQPVKAALASKGRMNACVRPPLVEASAKCRELIVETLKTFEAR